MIAWWLFIAVARRKEIAKPEPPSIADLEQRNLELDQLLYELDPDTFPEPITVGPLDGDRLDQLRDEFRPAPPARRRSLMEEAQVENRYRTLAAIDAAMKQRMYGRPTNGWDVDHDAVALMCEAQLVTIHGLAGVMRRRAEEVRILLTREGIPWDPMRDMVRGQDIFRLFNRTREQSAKW